MSFQLPVSLDFGSLPDTGQGYTPQEFADRLGINARVFTEQQFALFVTGATAPTSDVGPWAANGNEWRYWDSGTGSYVPFVIPSESLGYFVGVAAPDPAIYQVWVELNGTGSPLAIKTYFSGAWVDVYATTLGSYLTIAAAAAAYQPLNANLTTVTTSTLGDVIYSSAANTLSKLAGNTVASKRFLAQTGTGAVSAAPSWAAIIAGDIPDISATYLTVATAATTYAPLASPALTGTPTSPTAAPGTNTTQISSTAFVTAAIAAIPGVTIVAGQGVFRASPTANQDIVHGGAGSITTDVDFGTEAFDPDADFGSNIFTAPADGYYTFQATLQLSVSAGAPTDVDYWGVIVPSTGPSSPMSGRDDTGTAQSFSTGSCTIFLSSGNTVKVQVTSVADAAATVRVNSAGSYFSGFRIR